MATGVGMGFDLDAALRNAEKLDKKLSDMVANASKLEQTMTNAFRAGGATEILSRLQQRLSDIGNKKVDVHFETKKAEEMYSIMDRIVGTMTTLSQGGKVELFDTQKVYETADSILVVEKRLSDTEKEINKLRTKWSKLSFEKWIPEDFVAPVNPRTGKEYGKRTDTYKIALEEAKKGREAEVENDRLKIEAKLKAQIEIQAIQQKELQWASMTEDQKAQYVQKRLNEVLKAEQKYTSEVQKEYSKLSSEIIRIYDQIHRTEKSVAKGEKTGIDVSKEKGQLTTLETQLREKLAHQQQIEQESGNLILQQIENFWVKVQERDRKGLEDRIKAQQEAKKREEEEWQRYIRTPEGAIGVSESAKSINDEREAIKLLIAARDNLSKSTANYQQVVDDLNNRIQKHRISVEQLTTAEKNEQTLQPTIRNEYARLLKELDNLAAAKKKVQETDAFKSGDAQAQKNLSEIVAREQDVQRRIKEIKDNAQGLLDETERKHAAERANNEIAEIERVERKRQEYAKLYTGLSPDDINHLINSPRGINPQIEFEQKQIKALTQAKFNLDKQDQNYVQTINRLDDEIAKHKRNIQALTEAERERAEQQKKQNQTFEGAIAFSNSAKTLEEERQAVVNLKAAREKLNTTDEDGKKQLDELNKRIKQHNKNIAEAEKGSEELQEQHRKLIDTAGQLKRAMAAAFSVSAIKGYVNKLIQIRGEFELQQRSLQVLLQNKDEANALWDKTVALAVKSPYTTKQLVTATKQLAAYRVESEKLYETNKMLADVSIGLGVDMNRLILAFGQVKAANFLRGTELRQFSEAGVNMLDELAKRFTALEGRAVSVGEVFERVSKRMVSFKDVEAVFKTITSEGGTFYQMQEKQSETLKGMMLNLKDSYELMLNDIGKSNEGMLKGFVSVMKFFVDQWGFFAEILKGSISLWLIYRISLLNSSKAMLELATKTGIAEASVTKLSSKQLWATIWQGIKKIGISLKTWVSSNKILLLISAIVLLAEKLGMAIWEHNAKLEEIEKRQAEINKTVIKIRVQYNEAKDDEEKRAALQKLIDLAQNELNIKINVNVKEVDSIKLDDTRKDIEDTINKANNFAAEFGRKFESATWDWLPTDDVRTDLKEFQKATQKFETKFANSIYNIRELLQKQDQTHYLSLFDERREDESIEAYYERIKIAMKILAKESNLYDEFDKRARKSFDTAYDALIGFVEDSEEAQKEIEKIFAKINIDDSIPLEKRRLIIETMINKQSLSEQWDEITTSFVQEWAKKFYNIPLVLSPKALDEVGFADWQKRYNAFLEDLIGNKNVNGITKITDALTERKKVIKELDDAIKEANLVVSLKDDKTQQSYTKEEIKAEEERLKLLKGARAFFGKGLKEQNKEESEELKRLKEQIRLVRQLADDYEEMWKKYGKAYADANIKSGARTNAFAELELDIEEFAVGSRQDEKNNLGKLLEKALGIEGGKVEVEKAVADVEVEVRWDLQEQANADLSRDIEKLFGNYEMSLELEKLNIPKDLAGQLFGVEAMDLTSLRNQLLDMVGLGDMSGKTNAEILGSNAYKNLHEHQQKELTLHLQKVSQMERKAQDERLKTYSKYLLKGMDERVRIKIEELRKLEEVEKDKDVYTPQQRADIRSAIQKEAQEALDKQAWDEFKNTDLYISLFEDLENASNQSLNIMIDRLQSLRESLNNLPPERLKEIVNQLEKAKEELEDRNPFKKFGNDLKDYFGNIGKRKEAKTAIDAYEHNIEVFKQEAETQREIILAYEERINKGESLNELEEIALENARASLARNTEVLNNAQKAQASYKKILDNIKKSADGIGKAFEGSGEFLNSMGSYITDMANKWEQAFGLSDRAKADIEAITGAAQAAGEIATGIGQIAGGNYLGGAMSLLSGVMSAFATASKYNDDLLQLDIDAEIKSVKRLQKAYEDLEEAINNAYDLNTLSQKQTEANQNLQDQINSYNNMIALEKDKKKLDQSAIDGYEEEIKDLEKQQKELNERVIEGKGGFGGESNIKSAAEAFVDAWLQAYKETGDGLSGLNDQFDEFYESFVKKQLLLQGTSKYLDSFFSQFDEEIAGIGKTTDAATVAKNIGELWKNTSGDLDAFLSGLAEALNIAETLGSTELAGLQAGIQGMSAEQSDVLAAYMNSIRFFVADSNTQLKALVAAQGIDTDVPNPMLAQLMLVANHTKTTADNTTVIKDMLESMTTSAQRMGGRGIKVVMD